MNNSTDTNDTDYYDYPEQEKFPVDVGLVITLSVVGIIVLGLGSLTAYTVYKRRKRRKYGRSESSRHLFFTRGMSTTSRAGQLDSSAEVEMLRPSVDSHDETLQPVKENTTPKKPERKKKSSSSAQASYENVYLDPKTGFKVRKSVSMQSGIEYIDKGATSSRDDLDDVFH